MNMVALVGQYVQLQQAGHVWKGLCPFHKDKRTKSFTVYSDHAYCFGCGRVWGPISFLMEFLHVDRQTAKEYLGEPHLMLRKFKKPSQKIRVISPDIINTWHSMLRKRREYFRKRLFTDETIDRERWGWDGHRYVVTVWDGPPGGKCVSVRRRASTPEMQPKYIGLSEHNPQVLYNLWNAKHSQAERIFVFFGEFDCALASQDGLPSVSPTNGQHTWLKSWNLVLRDYQIVVVPDRGEEMRGFQVATMFPGRSSVFHWPPGEFDDYNSFRLAGGSREDFLNSLNGMVSPSYSVDHYWEVS